eukprot:SAG31_NODE_4316_length_3363_cov_11.868862_2_plen_85_part_00
MGPATAAGAARGVRCSRWPRGRNGGVDGPVPRDPSRARAPTTWWQRTNRCAVAGSELGADPLRRGVARGAALRCAQHLPSGDCV